MQVKGDKKMKKYRLTFDFFDTREEAEKGKENILKNANYYYRKNKRISIQDWTSEDKTEFLSE